MTTLAPHKNFLGIFGTRITATLFLILIDVSIDLSTSFVHSHVF